jgi:hypothetical protein
MVEEIKQSRAKPEVTPLCFITLVHSNEGSQRLHLLIDSLRAFGGQFGQAPVWIFYCHDYDPTELATEYPETGEVAWIPLVDEESLPNYYFGRKVLACAQAEAMTAAGVRSLVWLDPNCLVIQPPTLLDLHPAYEAAFRPVHIRNVGSPADQPLDEFWGTIYRAIRIEDATFTVQSFVDAQSLRPYFNSHLFSIDPAKGVLRLWLEYFKLLIADRTFQSGACSSELHQIFLHQAILSALVAKLLPVKGIRILPPEYSYPLHLHSKVPYSQRVGALNDLVCAVYEEDLPHPQTIHELEIHEPLYSWLLKELPSI